MTRESWQCPSLSEVSVLAAALAISQISEEQRPDDEFRTQQQPTRRQDGKHLLDSDCEPITQNCFNSYCSRSSALPRGEGAGTWNAATKRSFNVYQARRDNADGNLYRFDTPLLKSTRRSPLVRVERTCESPSRTPARPPKLSTDGSYSVQSSSSRTSKSTRRLSQ